MILLVKEQSIREDVVRDTLLFWLEGWIFLCMGQDSFINKCQNPHWLMQKVNFGLT